MEHLEHDQTSARAIPGNNGMHGIKQEGNSFAQLSTAPISFLFAFSLSLRPFSFLLSLADHETLEK